MLFAVSRKSRAKAAAPHRARGRTSWTLTATIWCSFLCVALAVLLIGLTIWTLREDALRDASNDSRNIATVLAAQTAQSVRSVEVVLNDIVTNIRVSGAVDRTSFAASLSDIRTSEFLKLQNLKLPQSEVTAIADHTGRLISTSSRWPAPNIEIGDREYFRYFQDFDDPNIFVGSPVYSRTSSRPIIFFSKRVTNTEGVFLGVVYVGLDPGYFSGVYESIKSLWNQSFELIREDGSILVRYPGGDPIASTIPRSSPWYWTILLGGGDYSEHEGESRLVSVARVAHTSLFVNVAVSEKTALQHWRWRTFLIAIGTLIAIACPVGLLVLLKRQFGALLKSEANLEQTVEQLGVLNTRLDLAFNNMSQGLCFFDGQHRLIVCNRRFSEMYHLASDEIQPGLTLEELVGMRFAAGTAPKTMSRADYLEWRNKVSVSDQPSDTEVELADDRIFKISHRPMPDGGWVATHEDITASKRDELRISYMAHHDELTDLVNRSFFSNIVERAAAEMCRSGRCFAVLMLDLDRFKAINDSLGHSAGDQLLREVGIRLKKSVAEGDVVARLGGDEFAVLVGGSSGEAFDEQQLRDYAAELAQRLIGAMNYPFVIDGITVGIGTSIGIVFAPEHGFEPAQLLKRADLALYRSKSNGRNNHTVFDDRMIVESNDLHKLESDMRSGLRNAEFELHYQAIFDAATRRIVGAEALVRWRHPELGMLSPARFIPIAEASGLMMPLGEFILRQACIDAATWPDALGVSVNLSAVQFRDAHLFDRIVEALDAAGLPPRRLEVEVTESVLLENNSDYASLLHRLKSIGVSVALDDFGTGYSSLSYLKQFPFDKIKIDKSFVQDVAESNDSMAIVSAVIALARGMNMMTTAEGIETERQFAIMRAAGVTLMQGFLLSKPCSLQDFDPGSLDTANSIRRA